MPGRIGSAFLWCLVLGHASCSKVSFCTLGAGVDSEDEMSRNAWLDAAIDDKRTTQGSWRSPAESEGPDALPKELVSEVRTSEVGWAMALLTDRPAVPISTCEANRVSSTPLEQAAGRDPYLLRGVMFSRQTGNFDVGERDETVWVMHGSLGGEMPLRRWPVLAMLRDSPERVYVDAWLAE